MINTLDPPLKDRLGRIYLEKYIEHITTEGEIDFSNRSSITSTIKTIARIRGKETADSSDLEILLDYISS